MEIGNRTFLDEKMQAVINAYDNAVLYNDEIVAEVIARVRRGPRAKHRSSISPITARKSTTFETSQDIPKHSAAHP